MYLVELNGKYINPQHVGAVEKDGTQGSKISIFGQSINVSVPPQEVATAINEAVRNSNVTPVAGRNTGSITRGR